MLRPKATDIADATGAGPPNAHRCCQHRRPLAAQVELASSRLEAMSYAALQAERGAWLRRPAAELPLPYAGREWRLEWLPQLEPLLRDRPVRKRFGQHGTWLGRVVGSFDAFFQVQSKYC